MMPCFSSQLNGPWICRSPPILLAMLHPRRRFDSTKPPSKTFQASQSPFPPSGSSTGFQVLPCRTQSSIRFLWRPFFPFIVLPRNACVPSSGSVLRQLSAHQVVSFFPPGCKLRHLVRIEDSLSPPPPLGSHIVTVAGNSTPTFLV